MHLGKGSGRSDADEHREQSEVGRGTISLLLLNRRPSESRIELKSRRSVLRNESKVTAACWCTGQADESVVEYGGRGESWGGGKQDSHGEVVMNTDWSVTALGSQ